MSVFVDTSALYALLVETEEDHRSVLRSFEQLLRKGRSLLTTNYVVLESVALLQHRFGLAPIRDLVDRLLPVITVRWVTESLHRRGFARLVARDRRQLSLVDCVSFEFMEEEGMQQALALDRDFEDEGFHTLPSKHGSHG